MTTRRLLAIASVERTGSTLLCSILRATKAAGNPVEYLNIVQPGAVYGDRLNSVDLRFGKILKPFSQVTIKVRQVSEEIA